MAAYFDSSVLLSIVLENSNAEQASVLWEKFDRRYSSILFEIECLVSFQRHALGLQSKKPIRWKEGAESLLEKSLLEINLIGWDKSLITTLRNDTRFYSCRSLDAIHLATATHFRQGLKEISPSFCTFDNEQAAAAKSLGFTVLPEERPITC